MHLSKPTLSTGLLLAFSMITTVAQADAQVFKSGVKQVQLIELYTSEGCSSCPPADKYLSRLKADKDLWKEQIPVAFHVDYWDYIGWQDPFASALNSQRQREHAAAGNVSTVYTPGFVVDGQEWRAYFHGGKLPSQSKLQPGPLELSYDNGQVKVGFQTTTTSADLTLQMAWLGAGLETTVTAGENRGRKLKHDFVVLKQAQAELSANQGYQYTGEFAADNLAPAEQYALVAWLEDKSGRPVQAVGGWASP